jgi:hypothetical protein
MMFMLKSVYPDHTWLEYKFHQAPRATWHKAAGGDVPKQPDDTAEEKKRNGREEKEAG